MNYKPAPARIATNADETRAKRAARRAAVARKRDEFRPMTRNELTRYLQENAR